MLPGATSADNGANSAVDADADPAGAAAALGIEGAADQDGADEGTGEESEPTLADVLALIQEQKREIATLKRENAAKRVQSNKKVATAPKAGEAADQDVTAAEERGREAARMEFGIELADAQVRAALATIVPEDQMDEFVDDLNLSKLVGDDGKPDKDAIVALKERQAKLFGTRKTTVKVGSGNRTAVNGKKSTADQFAEATKSFFS